MARYLQSTILALCSLDKAVTLGTVGLYFLVRSNLVCVTSVNSLARGIVLWKHEVTSAVRSD